MVTSGVTVRGPPRDRLALSYCRAGRRWSSVRESVARQDARKGGGWMTWFSRGHRLKYEPFLDDQSS
jgi:hypothetical protein